MNNISDTLVISYDLSYDDIPVLTVGRQLPDGKIAIIRTLGGESAVNLYSRITNHTILMPKGNGRSMVRQNMAEMFNVETKIPRGNGKSGKDMEAFINGIYREIYNAFKVKGELL